MPGLLLCAQVIGCQLSVGASVRRDRPCQGLLETLAQTFTQTLARTRTLIPTLTLVLILILTFTLTLTRPGDWFNRLDWSMTTNNFPVGLPVAPKNREQWPEKRPFLARQVLMFHLKQSSAHGGHRGNDTSNTDLLSANACLLLA